MATGNIRQRSKRKDSWTIQVFLGQDSETGKRDFHSETIRGTKAEAQRRLRELLAEVERKTFVRPTNVTLEAFLDRWLDEYGESRLRSRTIGGYRSYIARYVPGWLSRKRVVDVRAEDISRFEMNLRRGGGEGGRALSGRTVLQMHRILSSAFTYAVRQGVVGRNVVTAVEPPRIERFEGGALEWDDVGRLLGVIEEGVFRTLVLLALQTGLRRSELLGLQWRDVDFARRQLSVRRARVRVKGVGLRVEGTKSGKSRVVDVPEDSVEALLGMGKGEGHGFVFGNEDGVGWDPDWVTRRFKVYVDRAGFLGFRFHDLRHTHASLMLAGGVHLKIVSERLGHSGIGITGDLYSHVLPTVQLDAVERFGVSWRERLANGWQKVGKEGGPEGGES